MTLAEFLSVVGDNKDAIIAIGVFFAAGAAMIGTVAASLIAARNARRNHISALREKWIDGLRSDLAELVHLATANVAWGAGETEEGSPLKARRIATRIRLRLTGENVKHDDLDRSVNCLREILEGDDSANIDEQCETVVRLGKIVLKEAWEQAKTGD